MQKPEISIIMPIYNGEKYLAEAIESLLNQTFSNFELITIDDSSTDNTLKIVKEYQKKDQRVKLVQNEFDKGIVGGLNTGLKHAQGKYIARADADDIYNQDRLEFQYKFLEKNPDISLLGGGYTLFDSQGDVRNVYHPSSSVLIAWKFLSDTFFCHPTVMFRKEIANTVGGYPDETAEDFAFFSKIVKQYKSANLKTLLIRYRRHEGKLSMQKRSEIAQSAKNTFFKNYQYYIGNIDFAKQFFEFQKKNVLKTGDLSKMLFINWKILKQIRVQYKIGYFSFLFWLEVCKIESRTVYVFLRYNFVKALKFIFKK